MAKSMSKFVLKYPNGIVKNVDHPPTQADLGHDYQGGHWVGGDFNFVGMEVFHIEFSSFNVTFCTPEETIVVSSDHINETELPHIPEIKGKEGYWDIPKFFVEDTLISPSYKPIKYKAQFIDHNSTRPIIFTIDHPIKSENFPPIHQIDGYHASWDTTEVPLTDCTIRAVYCPIKVIFIYDGLETVQTYPSIHPPSLEKKPGYTRKWKLPKKLGNDDLKLAPVEYPTEYKLTIEIGDRIETTRFTIKRLPKMPEVDNRTGFKVELQGFDPTLPRNQHAKVVYTPVSIRYHLLDGSIVESLSTNMIVPPELEDGYYWPEYSVLYKDIDLYPKTQIYFALFYVHGVLQFCVPYTVTDRHYIDEMLTKNTVPKSRGKYGRWVQKESINKDTELFVAEYDGSKLAISDDELSYNWDVQTIADQVTNGKLNVVIDGEIRDLFTTRYVEYTGISTYNYSEYVSLDIYHWLKREHIPHIDTSTRYQGKNLPDGRFKIVLAGGRFWIGYRPQFDEALSFLEEYDIYFITPRKNRNVGGLPGKYLQFEIYYNEPDEFEEVLETENILTLKIPSRAKPESEYSVLHWRNEDFDLSNYNIQLSNQSNEAVISVFNLIPHPECEFTIIGKNIVELSSCHSDESEYAVPSVVLLSDNDQQEYTVKVIGKDAFKNNAKLISVYIPESVEEIHESAFEGCHSLVSVIGGFGVKSIGPHAFMGCDCLDSLGYLMKVLDVSEDSFPDTLKTSSERDSDVAFSKSVCKSDDNIDEDELLKFIAALEPCEKSYLRAVCLGEDTSRILADCKIRKDTMEIRINEKSSDILDCDELICMNDDTNEDEISEDYYDDLINILGD